VEAFVKGAEKMTGVEFDHDNDNDNDNDNDLLRRGVSLLDSAILAIIVVVVIVVEGAGL